MLKEEIIKKFEGREPLYVSVLDVNLSKYREYATPMLKFNNNTMDTYYSLPIKESIDNEIVNSLFDEGWSLNEEENNFIIYMKF